MIASLKQNSQPQEDEKIGVGQGDENLARADFELLSGPVKEYHSQGHDKYVKDLRNNHVVTLRSISTDKRWTLEIQGPNTKNGRKEKYKIRYHD